MINIEKLNGAFMRRYEKWFLIPLYRALIPYQVKRIRNKETINVLFVITEIGPWKTKELYDAMLLHPRFKPSLGVTISLEIPEAKSKLKSFLRDNNYNFVDLDDNTIEKFASLSPDIIFYQKPYSGCYKPEMFYKAHLNSLFCYVNYAFNSTDLPWAVNQPLFSCVWQQYYENSLTGSVERQKKMQDNKKRMVITGLPTQDQLLVPKEAFADPWKKQPKRKKRIIYAPHHTIEGIHSPGLAISSFMETGELMLELMHKYSDQVQWAFKPHPVLYKNLQNVWGKEKTDSYYNEWRDTECSQFEDGAYDALFKYSDAMIHDCSSFTIEYHYTKNPVMYLMRKKGQEVSYNSFAQKAFDLHYKGFTQKQIEEFIRNVINGVDPMKQEREEFYKEYLVPPHGKTAAENIINAILGIEEYK